MRNICGFLVIVLVFCGFESSMSRKQDEHLCVSLCTEFYSYFTGGNPKNLHENKILQDNLVKRMCDCSSFGRPDLKRMRRSIATSSRPRPTAAIGNETNEASSNAKINTTDSDNNEPSGVSPVKGIKFVNPNVDLSKYNIKKPKKFAPLPKHLLKHMYPQIYKATIYCNYTPYDSHESETKDMKSIAVEFQSDGKDSFNVSWVPPEELDNVSDFLVMWNPQPKPNSVPKIEDNFMRCRAVPKNQTFVVLKENTGWEYPRSLYLTVITTPAQINGKAISLKVFNPINNPVIIPVPPKHGAKDATLQKGSIAGGVVAGIAFISVLFFLLYRKKCRHSESPENEIGITIPIYANNTDGRAKILNGKADTKPKNVDIYFGSYLPESEKYANEVATIASMLRANGYRVVFDQVDSVELNSMGFNLWVEKQILEAKKYIVFCSPGYVKLWQTLATNAQDSRLDHIDKEDLVRVRYEIKRITDIYSESCSTSKIICIKMDQKMSMKSLPPWMNHNMLLWPEQKYDIIRRLNDQAAMIMDL